MASTDRHILVCDVPSGLTGERAQKFHKWLQKQLVDATGSVDKFKTQAITDNNGITIGYFVAFPRLMYAETAIKELNGKKLGPKDVIHAYPIDEVERSQDVPDTYVPPEIDSNDSVNDDDVSSEVMLDPKARPQFLMKFNDSDEPDDVIATLNWVDYKANRPVERARGPTLRRTDPISTWTEYDRQFSKNSNKPRLLNEMPMWSPLGTYLATLHEDGIRLWGGKTMSQVLHITESDIERVDISPSEKYMVVKTSSEVTLWSVKMARRLYTLKSTVINLDSWPVIRFNSDDSLFSVHSKDGITLYDVETNDVIKNARAMDDKCTIMSQPESTLLSFDFSPQNPKQAIVVRYSSAGYSVQAINIHVRYKDEFTHEVEAAEIEDLGSRNFMRASPPYNRADYEKTLKNLTDEEQLDFEKQFREARFAVLWNSSGTHVVVRAAKYSRYFGGEVEFKYDYMLLRISHNNISAEQIKLEGQPLRLNWQAHGPYFAIIVKSDKVGREGDRSVLIYDMNGRKDKPIGVMPTKGTRLLWSPRTPRVACVDFGTSTVDVFAINEKTGTVTQCPSYAHHKINNAEWDPTGRYLLTWTSTCAQSNLMRSDNFRYVLRDINNACLSDVKLSHPLHRIAFRPISPLLLSAAEQTDVKNHLHEYIARHEKQEEDERRKKAQEAKDKKMKEGEIYINALKEVYEDQRKNKIAEQREYEIKSSLAYMKMSEELRKINSADE